MIAYMIVMACSVINGNTYCPESENALLFPTRDQCEAFIRREDFDPSDYAEIGSQEFFSVGCEES